MFENLANDIEKSIIRQIQQANLINLPYSGLFKLPDAFISKVWSNVDQEQLAMQMSKRIESELADRIVNAMASEIATDIKQVLSVKERREAIRSVCRDNLDKIVGGK